MSHVFIFLSDKFYRDYPRDVYSEIERKQDRPYIQVCVRINDVLFAVPLRSNIHHSFVLWTDKHNHCGVDFSKAVVIADAEYIDTARKPHLRENEFAQLMGKEFIIETKMKRYIAKYKKAKADPKLKSNAILCRMSTLQYFEEYI